MLLEKLDSDRKRGIMASSVENREKYFGSNRKPPKKLKSVMDILLGALDDFTLKVLIVASILSISKKI
jgi:Ca2+ transporting ATPase